MLTLNPFKKNNRVAVEITPEAQPSLVLPPNKPSPPKSPITITPKSSLDSVPGAGTRTEHSPPAPQLTPPNGILKNSDSMKSLNLSGRDSSSDLVSGREITKLLMFSPPTVECRVRISSNDKPESTTPGGGAALIERMSSTSPTPSTPGGSRPAIGKFDSSILRRNRVSTYGEETAAINKRKDSSIETSFNIGMTDSDVDGAVSVEKNKMAQRQSRRYARNSDSMLEDIRTSKSLKSRLSIRYAQVTKNKLTSNKGLSDFIMSELTTGKVLPSAGLGASLSLNHRLEAAADLAIKVIFEGYFTENGGEFKNKAKLMFEQNLNMVEYEAGEYVCRQGEAGEKLYILEEGSVEFLINSVVIGNTSGSTSGKGAIFGELSLIYGVPRQADVRAETDLIVWSLDSLGFRRIQAIIARESLKVSKSKIMTKFSKEASALASNQENSIKIVNTIPFDDLQIISAVGQGTFGSVFICSAKDRDVESFALKKMSKKSIAERENEKRVVIEKNALQAMAGCPFIITLMGTYVDRDCIYFLTECVQGGNLISYMIEKDILSHSEGIFFMACIAKALIHCHNRGYIHRDIKPENCLIDSNGYVKLCDFGMAKRLPSTILLPSGGTEVVLLAFTMCGTPEFMAPEFVLSTGYDKGVDFWALGCVFVEMYCGRGPFDFDGDLKKTFKAVCLIGMGRKKLDLPRKLLKKGMENAKDLANKLLVAASNRLGTDKSEDVINHPYFTGLDMAEMDGRCIQAPYIPKIKGAKDASNFKKDAKAIEDEVEPYEGPGEWCDAF